MTDGEEIRCTRTFNNRVTLLNQSTYDSEDLKVCPATVAWELCAEHTTAHSADVIKAS